MVSVYVIGMTDTLDTVIHLGVKKETTVFYSGGGEPAVMGSMQMLPVTENTYF
jgi:hypothetical protein